LQASKEPEEWSIGTVQGLFPSFTRSLCVNSVGMEKKDVDLVLNSEGDLNDLIINAQLLTIASAVSLGSRVLAVPTHETCQIIYSQLNCFRVSWTDYDVVLCPINQNHHWYLIIIDIKQKLIVELDSLPSANLPKDQNMNRLLHFLDMQFGLKQDNVPDFNNDWKLATPLQDLKLQQDDLHSCGIHVLLHAEAYLNQTRFSPINKKNIRLYRYQIAESLLRKADNVINEADYESVSI
jgi:hypothetical protein